MPGLPKKLVLIDSIIKNKVNVGSKMLEGILYSVFYFKLYIIWMLNEWDNLISCTVTISQYNYFFPVPFIYDKDREPFEAIHSRIILPAIEGLIVNQEYGLQVKILKINFKSNKKDLKEEKKYFLYNILLNILKKSFLFGRWAY